MLTAGIASRVGLIDRNELRKREPAFRACVTQRPVPLRWTADSTEEAAWLKAGQLCDRRGPEARARTIVPSRERAELLDR
jgi:hypothetical protein